VSVSERLNKYLALQLGVSRREADSLIEHGHVKIDGVKAILGARVEAGSAITVKGKPLTGGQAYEYVLFNKPAGYVSSRRRQGDTPTLYELIPETYHHLKPVGRLDKDSSGLILLTNDGDFAFQMTHPKFYKVKKYDVTLDQALQPLHQQMINDFGVALEDGPSKLTLEKQSDDRLHWQVTMHEGRNRQIRRTFAALGYTVTGLHRTDFGNYTLGDVVAGQWVIVDAPRAV
jgi:23S rRNA pseudouridine2605 synthase